MSSIGFCLCQVVGLGIMSETQRAGEGTRRRSAVLTSNTLAWLNHMTGNGACMPVITEPLWVSLGKPRKRGAFPGGWRMENVRISRRRNVLKAFAHLEKEAVMTRIRKKIQCRSLSIKQNVCTGMIYHKPCLPNCSILSSNVSIYQVTPSGEANRKRRQVW